MRAPSTASQANSYRGIAPRTQADNGFLDACHIITAIRMPTGAKPGSGTPQYRLFYMVELAAPPLPRPSGVAGLNVEDFCGETQCRRVEASRGRVLV